MLCSKVPKGGLVASEHKVGYAVNSYAPCSDQSCAVVLAAAPVIIEEHERYYQSRGLSRG